jgi:hypothetical protein
MGEGCALDVGGRVVVDGTAALGGFVVVVVPPEDFEDGVVVDPLREFGDFDEFGDDVDA